MDESHGRTGDLPVPAVAGGSRPGMRKARRCRSSPTRTKGASMDVNFDKETGIGPTDPQGKLTPEEKALPGDIQGNILKSHGRDHSRHLFITFDKAKAKEARIWLAQLSKTKVTSALKQWDESRLRAEIFEKSRQAEDPEAYLGMELA